MEVSKECGLDFNSAQREQRLNERLNQVVHEHHQWLVQLENEELILLRTECLKLRNEVSTLSAEAKMLRENGPSEITQTHRPTEHEEQAVHEGSYAAPQQMPHEEEVDSTKHHVNARVLEDREAEVLDLKQQFHDLDPEQKGYISFGAISPHLLRSHQCSDSSSGHEVLMTYRSVIYKLNCQNGTLAQLDGHCAFYQDDDGNMRKQNKQDNDLKFHLYYSTFKTIMLESIDLLNREFGADMTQAIIDLRQALVDDLVKERICEAWRIKAEEVETAPQARHRDLKSDARKVLEPFVAAMIILNALIIGISLDNDPDWDGWVVLECFFTGFFGLEIVVAFWIEGCVGFWFGKDWAWNWFDVVVVVFAFFDIFFAAEGWDMSHFTVLRLVRIIRIARLLRILRLKMFKELALMVNGVIAGLRTLFWAIVLLAIFVYALGVLMRQLMDIRRIESSCFDAVTGKPSTIEQCNRGERLMTQYGDYMFSSVPRSMLTIFFCFTDGCSSPDGTPLVWHLWDTHGPVLVVGYVISFLFISFGVLNLIMAVFVENTLQNAERTDAERQFGDQSRPTKARELQTLLNKFCKEQRVRDASLDNIGAMIKRTDTIPRKIEQLKSKIIKAASDSSVVNTIWPLKMRVTQDQFEEILKDPEVHDIFDDLDISCISREQLFDILDSDGNGFLAISELIDGIMKLRGPLDKGDGVASVLMMRQLQKQLSKFEHTMRSNFKKVDSLFATIEKRHGASDDGRSISFI